MAIWDLFSYRKKVAEGKVPDVYSYDKLPQTLRVQIVHILLGAIGSYHVYGPYEVATYAENNIGWQQIEKCVVQELGLFNLGNGRDPNVCNRCMEYLLESQSIDHVLDLIEVSFQYINQICRAFNKNDQERHGISLTASDAITQLNERFRRAGVGYQFENGRIIPIDSELIHTEAVRPTLQFLSVPGFEGPRDEYLKAYEHYKSGEYRDAITDAHNAFESTLKAICAIRSLKYSKGARASDLLKTVRSEGIFPDYLSNSFEQLIATLKSGLPQVRNNEGSHGQGPTPSETPDYVAMYAIHLAAVNIKLLADAHYDTWDS